MYNDMYETFDNKKLTYSYPINFIIRNRPYLQSKLRPNKFWYYGDTVDLELILIKPDYERNDEEINDFLLNKKVVVTFYNWRKEPVYERTFIENAAEINAEKKTLVVPITADVSSSVFKRGSYSCQVQIMDLNAEAENQKIITVVPAEFCLFYVK